MPIIQRTVRDLESVELFFDDNKRKHYADAKAQLYAAVDGILLKHNLVPIIEGRLQVSQEPYTMLRIETLRLLLDLLSVKDDQDGRDDQLRRTGEYIGRSFAYTLFLDQFDPEYKTQTVLPPSAFAKYWALTDHNYGWGNIDVNVANNEMPTSVVISTSFLVDDDAHDGHARCAFMEGYIRGVLDEGFRYSTFCLRQLQAAPHPAYAVDSVTETKQESQFCQFSITYFSSPPLQNAYDQHFRAWESYHKPNLDDANRANRLSEGAIRLAVKEILGKPKMDVEVDQLLGRPEIVRVLSAFCPATRRGPPRTPVSSSDSSNETDKLGSTKARALQAFLSARCAYTSSLLCTLRHPKVVELLRVSQ